MEVCNILRYDRSIYPGKAVFYYKTQDSEFEPLQAEINSIRGQKCGYAEAYTDRGVYKKPSPQDLAFSNLIVLEECFVPPNVDIVYCRFSLRILANSLAPSAVVNPDVHRLLYELAEELKNCGGYKDLARRYAKNLLMGTWLWKNRNLAEAKIRITTSSMRIFEVNDIRELEWSNKWPEQTTKMLEELSDEIEMALTEPKKFWKADVVAELKTDFCQELFPSQKLLEKQPQGVSNKQFVKTKCVDGREAVSFNSVKVGAALQMVDDWWDDEECHPIRVNEYGAESEILIARRMPDSKKDFHSLLENAENILEELKQCKLNPKQQISPQTYYFFSILIKGGMFQRKDVKKQKDNKQ